MSEIKISYVLTTFNKKSYLEITLPFFLSNLQSNEELIIYDGNSTDGTIELISSLIKGKTNVLFFSEKDLGEAHGLNKGILTANGDYIKIISDDDVYHFDTIRKAANWLDANPSIDWIGSNGISFFYLNKKNKFQLKDELRYFYIYKTKKRPFILTGLSYLIRRKSISKLGLFNTNTKIVDFEYSLRNLSNPKISFALSVLPFYVNIINPNSNSQKFYNSLIDEFIKYQRFYNGAGEIKLLIWLIKMKIQHVNSNKFFSKENSYQLNFSEIFNQSYEFIENYNKINTFIVENLLYDKY
jgi:glycosyltransferase involved in cell wall biosynthesis